VRHISVVKDTGS